MAETNGATAAHPAPLPSQSEISELPPDGGKHFNRLIFEKSPYLLQHARNPVDWYPWGEAAFAKAREEEKPIFLSVGYSTCHWCHVMERESFESDEVARLINAHFIPVKVDREERPDVDRIYMAYVQATTGSGGWPMSVFLTPELKPFFGGTYFPPDDRYGRPGFKSVLAQLSTLWTDDRDRVLQAGSAVMKELQRIAGSQPATELPAVTAIFDKGYQQIKASYEPEYGGFGDAPKFPRPVAIDFMLRYHHRTGAADALDMSLHTLRAMAGGGMYDHVGDGFHRYAVDTRWHVPHFEKMLYDQAQLVCSYLDAYQLTGDTFFADVARNTLAYVQRDMTGPHGEFFSAEDADSLDPERPGHAIEGAFYVWAHADIVAALGATDAAVFNHYYGVRKGGNVTSDPHGEFEHRNILIVSASLEETAQKFNMPVKAVRELLTKARKRLLEVRAGRPRPHRDDKALTAWNGLMISAFAKGYQVLGDKTCLAAARAAADFVRHEMVIPESGKLYRRFRDGQASIEGFTDDYAFFIQGLLDLYEAGFNIADLQWALALQEKQNTLFWDEEDGAYFSTSGDDASILVRIKDSYDGAEPSANSVSLHNLVRLERMIDNEPLPAMIQGLTKAFGERLERTPVAMPKMLSALLHYAAPPSQVILAAENDRNVTATWLAAVRSGFLPNTVLLKADGGEGQAWLAQHIAFIKDVGPGDDGPRAYVCENFSCKLPAATPDQLAEQLFGKQPR